MQPPAVAADLSRALGPALPKPAFVPLPMPAMASPRDICNELRRVALSIIRHYMKIKDVDPKPFVWTKTEDDIFASIERICLQTFNSRH